MVLFVRRQSPRCDDERTEVTLHYVDHCHSLTKEWKTQWQFLCAQDWIYFVLRFAETMLCWFFEKWKLGNCIHCLEVKTRFYCCSACRMQMLFYLTSCHLLQYHIRFQNCENRRLVSYKLSLRILLHFLILVLHPCVVDLLSWNFSFFRETTINQR